MQSPVPKDNTVQDVLYSQQLSRIAELALSLSDIDFLRWLSAEFALEHASPSAKSLIDRELQYYEFTSSEQAYRAHYAKYEGEFFAGPADGFANADWSKDPRLLAVLRALKLAEPSRVLDFGCSTGHITRTLATYLPDCEFVGIDITPQAVSMFNRLAPPNARAYTMDAWRLIPQEKLFDVVICAEVLEHVIDPYQTIDDLTECLKPEGAFLCTLPFGPWESRGWNRDDPHAREHVRHWGAAELRDVFGPTALAWHVGAPELGHTVTLSSFRVGTVSMPDKLRRYEQLTGGL